jgi:hypothetical protein
MKKIRFTIMLAAICLLAFTQISLAQLTALPDAGNRRAVVGEGIGITDVTIHYNRPHVKGREGHIWGQLIPPGFVDQGFGPSKSAPWRAGANENTWVEFSTDVMIEGQVLPAGKYGLFIAYDPNESTVIFSKNYTSWGSFFYDPAEDVLRVKVKPVPNDHSVEWLTYTFTDEQPASAVVQLQWEKLIIPIKISVDVVQTQIASFRRELRSEKGFLWESWDQAAQFCAQHKTNLDQALLWTDTATSVGFGGSQSFQAWATKAAVLDSLGRTAEGDAAMKKATPYGSINDLYFYGRTLARAHKGKEALDVFKTNYDKHPDEFLTNAGMARGYSAAGDYKKALTYAQKALAQAPDPANKATMERFVTTLQNGKDVN